MLVLSAHSDEEWEQLKKNIMDSLPDDDEEHHEDAWHVMMLAQFADRLRTKGGTEAA